MVKFGHIHGVGTVIRTEDGQFEKLPALARTFQPQEN